VSNSVSIVESVRKALAEDIGPALGVEGSAIEVIEVEAGVARLRLTGGCFACPSTIMTLITGVEQELRRRVPEVEYVEMTG
jgi:Fe-S cluster biogenesis protein NfuA